jgi:hypothetical protein
LRPFQQRALRWIEALAQNLRNRARHLRRAPGLVAVSVLSRGLGIGLNFSLCRGDNGFPTSADDDERVQDHRRRLTSRRRPVSAHRPRASSNMAYDRPASRNARLRAMAALRPKFACICIQNCGVVLKSCARRRAVSAVTPRLPLPISSCDPHCRHGIDRWKVMRAMLLSYLRGSLLSHGFRSWSPVDSKSTTLRVTTVNP